MNNNLKRIKTISKSNRFMEWLIYCSYLVYGNITRILYIFLGLCGVKQNKIVLINMKGSRYGDNPMYISEELYKKRNNYEIVWLLDKSVVANIPNYVKRVDNTYLNRAKELSTAAVWVDSNMKDYGIHKKKSQMYIQTWHGSYGIKRVALDVANAHKVDELIFPYNAKIEDFMVSNSNETTEIYRRAFKYDGEVIQYGSPRNDVFFSSKEIYKERIVKHFKLESATKIVLYAPTFRTNYNIKFLSLNYERLIEALTNKLGGMWKVMVRMHPQNLDEASSIVYSDNIINASGYSIMQELLVASDILVTDYSSCMFDFITKPKPCFIYAPDLEEYEKDRGNYFRMDELPFPLARNNDELMDNIRNFDIDKYTKDVEVLHERVGLCETGHASEAVADYIIDFIENGRK